MRLMKLMRQTTLQLPKGSVILATVAVLSIILGFAREAITAYYFGASEALDTFLIALTIPKMLVVTVVQFSVAVILPVYVGYKQNDNSEFATKLVQKWFWVSGIAITIICVVLFVWANSFIYLLAPGFNESKLLKASYWLRTLLPYVWLLATTGVFKIVLNSNDKFFVPSVSNQIVSICVIFACIFFAPSLSVGALSIGFLVGGLFGFTWQYLFCRKYEPQLLTVSGVKSEIKLPLAAAGAMLLYYSSVRIDTVIDRFFASQLIDGSIAAYNFAQSINAIPSTIITSVLSTTLFPVLSRMGAGGNMKGAFVTVSRWSLIGVAVVIVPVVLMIIFREQIVSIVFERGAFDENDVRLTASALNVLPLRIPLAMVSVLFTFLLIANKKHYLVSVAVILFISLKTVLSYFLVTQYALTGLALATVIASLFYAVMLFLISWKIILKNTLISSCS